MPGKYGLQHSTWPHLSLRRCPQDTVLMEEIVCSWSGFGIQDMSEPPLCLVIACVWLLLADAGVLRRDAYTKASLLLGQCQINKKYFVFLSAEVSLSHWRSHSFAHKQRYLPIYTVVHKMNCITSVVFLLHPETFLKVTQNKCAKNTRGKSCELFVFWLVVFFLTQFQHNRQRQKSWVIH